MTIKKRIELADAFVREALGEYKVLNWVITINSEPDEEYTDFEVRIQNTTNSKKHYEIVRVHDYGGLEILEGEEFEATSVKDFLAKLFMSYFLTFVEV